MAAIARRVSSTHTFFERDEDARAPAAEQPELVHDAPRGILGLLEPLVPIRQIVVGITASLRRSG